MFALAAMLCVSFVMLAHSVHAMQGSVDVADFKKQYPKFEKKASKVEAILGLEKAMTAEVAEVLLPILKEEDNDVRAAAIKVLAGNTSPEAIQFLIGIIKKEKALRAPICQVLGLGKRKEGRAEIEKLLKESDWLVRMRAVEALGSIGDKASAPVIIPLALDPETSVKVSTLDAMTLIADDTFAAPLIASLQDKHWRVRTAAIAGLCKVRTRDAITPLVKIVESDEGRLVEDASRALKALTGRDFGHDYNRWKEWYEAYGKDPNYKLPTVEELAKIEAKKNEAPRAGETGIVKERKINEFLGVTTPSKKILFILDCSGSMDDLILEKDRYRNQNYPGFRKIDIVKEELARTIARFDMKTDFAIVTFATKVRPWRKGELIQANSVNKATAIDFAHGLEPIGGSGKEDLAKAGLGGSAALGEGMTNTYAALMFGLGNPKRGVIERDSNPTVDTIFFLSDGKPSTGEFVDTDDILAAVKEANTQKKITIHVLGIGDFEKGFMRQLAEQNSGQFVDLGK